MAEAAVGLAGITDGPIPMRVGAVIADATCQLKAEGYSAREIAAAIDELLAELEGQRPGPSLGPLHYHMLVFACAVDRKRRGWRCAVTGAFSSHLQGAAKAAFSSLRVALCRATISIFVADGVTEQDPNGPPMPGITAARAEAIVAAVEFVAEVNSAGVPGLSNRGKRRERQSPLRGERPPMGRRLASPASFKLRPRTMTAMAPAT